MRRPQRQLGVEFYPKLVGICFQNSLFEVQCSLVFIGFPEDLLGNEEGHCSQAMDTDHLVSAQGIPYTTATCLSMPQWWKWANNPQQMLCLLCLETGLLPWKNFSLYP